MPGVLSGLNHSLDIHAWGRSRIPRSSSSSWRLLTQSSSQVPSTVTLRLLRRRLSNCSSRQRFPSVFPARHRASEHEGDLASGWCHGTLVATTAEGRGAGQGWNRTISPACIG
jgi:hypothetical protein